MIIITVLGIMFALIVLSRMFNLTESKNIPSNGKVQFSIVSNKGEEISLSLEYDTYLRVRKEVDALKIALDGKVSKK